MTRILTIIALLFATPAWAQNVRDRGRWDGPESIGFGEWTSFDTWFWVIFFGTIIVLYFVSIIGSAYKNRQDVMPYLARSYFENGPNSDEFIEDLKEYSSDEYEIYFKINYKTLIKHINKNRNEYSSRYPNIPLPVN